MLWGAPSQVRSHLAAGTALGFIADSILGGSWVVISRVISRVTIPITHIRGLITPTCNYP